MTMTSYALPATTMLIVADADADAIGTLYRESQNSIVASVRALHSCGTKLVQKKATLRHGNWLPWLESQRDALGFGERTAQTLVRFSLNTTLTADLTADHALVISRAIWGNVVHAIEAEVVPKVEINTVADVPEIDDDTASRPLIAGKPRPRLTDEQLRNRARLKSGEVNESELRLEAARQQYVDALLELDADERFDELAKLVEELAPDLLAINSETTA